jgi:ribosome-binding factor A
MSKSVPGAKGPGTRPKRIAAELQRELPELIRRHVQFPDGVLVSITGVELSPDLSHAKIFFSLYAGNHEAELAVKVRAALQHKRGVLRSEIAKILVMRQHPDLHFFYDETPAKAAHIESLFKQIERERTDRHEPDES